MSNELIAFASILCVGILMLVLINKVTNYCIEAEKGKWAKERIQKLEKEENEEREKFIDEVDKRKEFYRKICSQNYDYIDASLFRKESFTKSENTEGLDIAERFERFEQRRAMVEMFAFRDVLEENFRDIGMNLHLIKLSSLRNSEGMARIVKYIMVVPKAYDQKEYCEGIQKLLKKELGLYAKVSDLKDESCGCARYTQTIQQKSFRYKGYYVNALDRDEVVLISEVGFVKTFDKISDCISKIEYL